MTFSRCPTPATQFVTTPRSPDTAIRKKHVTIYTPHFTLHTVQVALLHSTLYTLLLTLHALHVTQHSTLHAPTLQTLHFTDYTSHRALLTALATQNSIPHTTDLHPMLRQPRKMTLSKFDGSLARNIDCEVGAFGVIRNELVGKL